MKRRAILSIFITICLALSGQAVLAQTTEFSFQGVLNSGGSPATGFFDFEFRLYDAVSGGTQQGSTLQKLGVQVTNGIYAVSLDFSAAAFPGAVRFLEISVRTAGGGAFTPLTPRQKISSAPYAIRSINATNADTVNVGGIPSGSGNYIQNTTVVQPASNFNISGNGSAGGTLSGNIVNAVLQFNLGSSRVLSAAGTDNLFVGIGAGQGIGNGSWNAFFGQNAGYSNFSGHSNSFFGNQAGYSNVSGIFNAFFGNQAGYFNTASGNAFFGHYAGYTNSTGSDNSFFGAFAGNLNSSGSENTFFGRGAGNKNSSGGRNSFFGNYAGGLNTTGAENAFFGYMAGGANTEGLNNVFVGTNAGSSNTTGSNNTVIGYGAGLTAGNLQFATAIGAGATASSNNSIVLGRSNGLDIVVVNGLGAAGSTSLCRNGSNQIANCSSSIRYKSNIESFGSGLDLIRRLRPVSFNWKDGGMRDFGLVAEEVQAVAPLLVTYNGKGEVEGVKYDRVGVVLVNAVKEQQTQIEAQQKQIDEQRKTIERQQAEIDALKKFICSQSPAAAICKEKSQ